MAKQMRVLPFLQAVPQTSMAMQRAVSAQPIARDGVGQTHRCKENSQLVSTPLKASFERND
jgi:hypothetical protein